MVEQYIATTYKVHSGGINMLRRKKPRPGKEVNGSEMKRHQASEVQ